MSLEMEDYQKSLETLQAKLSDKEKALQDSQSEVSRTEKRAQDFKAQIGEIMLIVKPFLWFPGCYVM